MKRALTVLLGAAMLIVAIQSTALSDDSGRARSSGSSGGLSPIVLQWATMAGVDGAFVGPARVNGVVGGGLPWVLARGEGRLRQGGGLFVQVQGLVIPNRPGIPAAVAGRNPSPTFMAIVTCELPNGTSQQIRTGQVPVGADGNATIRATVALPKPCVSPAVFVTSGTGAWFASTGAS